MAHALLLRRARRVLARARDQAQAGTPDGELNIVPFLDIVTNLLLFLLATFGAMLAVAQVDAQLVPVRPRGGGSAGHGSTVSVTLTGSGIFVSGPEGRLSPGCTAAAAGPAPTLPGSTDFSGLTACLARVRERTSDEAIVLAADPAIPYEHLLAAMDAIRADGDRPLFPRVLLSAGVR